MAYPATYRAWRRSTTAYPRNLVLSTETLSKDLEKKDVLIRIRAVSLNYRDHAMLEEGKYPVQVEDGGISASDCAAEVVAVGDDVIKFVVGDRVAPTIDLLSLTGDEREPNDMCLGGVGPGTLREYAVFEEKVLVRLPAHLSWEEASTIPTAGITVWKALDGLTKVRPDTVALLQGSGGCSVMAALICLAVGISPIITSSSDQKLAKLKKLSPKLHGLSYKTQDIKKEVLSITGGKGVDFILNNIGISSIPDDLDLIRKSGSIALVGFLEGFTAGYSPDVLLTILLKACKIQGVLAGSRVDFEALSAFLEEKKVSLEPIIDKVFSFESAPEAYKYLASGKHVGKVIIRIP